MNERGLSRRHFIRTSAVLTGAAVFASSLLPSARGAEGPTTAPAGSGKRTASDQVPLGKTGIMMSRVGIGTGSSNGYEQTAQGKETFTKVIHHAYDQGITYIDTAQAYQTFTWIADAIKGLPREKLFIQSKIDGRPENIMEVIDQHRTTFKTDYVDSMLVHCMTRGNWTDDWKRIMEAFDEAKQRQWIRAKGVSCHSLPALTDATKVDWSEVHLVRVNPQGKFMDTDRDRWGAQNTAPIEPVLDQIKSMHEKGRGVIGMKIFGNGSFTDLADREKSVQFAMSNPNIDAIVIGMKTPQQVDENLAMINRVLAAA
jgi:aryl-alcohol dehydrogenase-like predicted oxidoreductase